MHQNKRERKWEKNIMKYRLEGNELIIKGLFSEKRYDFRELTKVSFAKNIYIYKDEKCILKEKDINQKLIYRMDIFHLAVKNNLIFEDRYGYENKISVGDVHDYSMSVQEKLKEKYYDYVKQELGEEYELVISTDETPYHVRIFFNVYCNGEKMYIKDEPERLWCTDYLNGKKDIHLYFFELVVPEYIDIINQKFILTKLVDMKTPLGEFEEQISIMRESGCVTVSSLLKG